MVHFTIVQLLLVVVKFRKSNMTYGKFKKFTTLYGKYSIFLIINPNQMRDIPLDSH